MSENTPTGLFDVLQHLRRTVVLNFPESLWIKAEIAQIRESRGHIYLEIIEKDSGTEEWIAQAGAVLWQNQRVALTRKLGTQLRAVLQEGMEILCKARVDFHERYGLKLVIEDVDPAYTAGQLALERQKRLEALQREGLIGKNRSLPLPPVLQRVAILSSPQAAGLQDFEQQLLQNTLGYRFFTRLFPAAMQGNLLENESIAQLTRIRAQSQQFDCVVIIRGGGSKLDLAGFDSLELCRAIAHFPLPVFTGIGHDIDQTLTDLVAHQALKTPTAVAEFLLQNNLAFETSVHEAWQWIRQAAGQQLTRQQLMLEHFQRQVLHLPLSLTSAASGKLDLATQKIPLLVQAKIEKSKMTLDAAEQLFQLLSIENTLQRGFTLTQINGKALVEPSQAKRGDVILTTTANGQLKSEVY
jgi:exodeoxyribonuclease VII large subunit